MEDDHHYFVYERWPQFRYRWKTTSIFMQMEDDLNILHSKSSLAYPSLTWACHSSAQACLSFFLLLQPLLFSQKGLPYGFEILHGLQINKNIKIPKRFWKVVLKFFLSPHVYWGINVLAISCNSNLQLLAKFQNPRTTPCGLFLFLKITYQGGLAISTSCKNACTCDVPLREVYRNVILYGHKERQTDTNNEGLEWHIIHSFELMNIWGGNKVGDRHSIHILYNN